MDLLLRGGTLVTCDASHRVMQGDLWVSGGRIQAMGAPDAVAEAMRDLPRAVRVLDARGAAVMPGFVQAHVHLCQTLFRGMADDLPLLEWLKRRIWPLEAAHDPDSLRASADLGIAELLLGGTTTILDMGTVRHHDAVFEALREGGLRAVSGKTMMDDGDDVPEGLRETTAASLAGERRPLRAVARRGGRTAAVRLRAALHPVVHRAALPRGRSSRGPAGPSCTRTRASTRASATRCGRARPRRRRRPRRLGLRGRRRDHRPRGAAQPEAAARLVATGRG
jgi:cytosine/adenosine deaminase-related metal-dependent hydrolase